MQQLRSGHLFAGAGGGILADLILGHKPIFAVEWDKYCCQVLRERVSDGWFDGMQVHECDIRVFDSSIYKGCLDILHAGFPCQDLSVAGKQSGLGEGTRSGLYREVLRIARIVRPRYLYLENVAAILSGGLEHVLADLAAIGYDCRWTCLRASECGAWHQRDRWFLLASDIGSKRVQGSCQKTVSGFKGFSWCQNVRRIEDLRNRPDLPPSLVRGIRHGIPNYVDRIKACGNGQVPLQAATAWRILGGP